MGVSEAIRWGNPLVHMEQQSVDLVNITRNPGWEEGEEEGREGGGGRRREGKERRRGGGRGGGEKSETKNALKTAHKGCVATRLSSATANKYQLMKFKIKLCMPRSFGEDC